MKELLWSRLVHPQGTFQQEGYGPRVTGSLYDLMKE